MVGVLNVHSASYYNGVQGFRFRVWEFRVTGVPMWVLREECIVL